MVTINSSSYANNTAETIRMIVNLYYGKQDIEYCYNGPSLVLRDGNLFEVTKGLWTDQYYTV